MAVAFDERRICVGRKRICWNKGGIEFHSCLDLLLQDTYICLHASWKYKMTVLYTFYRSFISLHSNAIRYATKLKRSLHLFFREKVKCKHIGCWIPNEKLKPKPKKRRRNNRLSTVEAYTKLTTCNCPDVVRYL